VGGKIAGEPFFEAKEWFPRTPSKKAVSGIFNLLWNWQFPVMRGENETGNPFLYHWNTIGFKANRVFQSWFSLGERERVFLF